MITKEFILYVISSVTAIATVVLAWLTSKYVKLTYFMVEEIRKSRDPLIIVDFQFKLKGHNLTKFNMIISNKGLSPAKDILIRAEDGTNFYRENYELGGKVESIKLNDLPIFKDGIPYLAPENNVTFY